MKRRASLCSSNMILVLVFCLLTFITTISVLPDITYAYHYGGHDNLACLLCHTTEPDPTVDTIETVDFIITDYQYELCLSCHVYTPPNAIQNHNNKGMNFADRYCRGAGSPYYTYFDIFDIYPPNAIYYPIYVGKSADHYNMGFFVEGKLYGACNCHTFRASDAMPGTSINIRNSMGDASMCYNCHQEAAASPSAPYMQRINQAFSKSDQGINPDYGVVKLPKVLVYDSNPSPGTVVDQGVMTITASMYHEEDNLRRMYKYNTGEDPETNGKGFYFDIKAVAVNGTEYPLPAAYTLVSLDPLSNYVNDPVSVLDGVFLNKTMNLSIITTSLPTGTYTISITPIFEGQKCGTMVYTDIGPAFKYQYAIDNSVAFNICDYTDATTGAGCSCTDTSCGTPITIPDQVASFIAVVCNTGGTAGIRAFDSFKQKGYFVQPEITSVAWTLNVSDVTLTKTTTTSDFNLAWDTRDSLGNLVPEGRYPYTITANVTYQDGSTAENNITGTVYVTRDYPAVLGNNRISAYDSHLIFNTDSSITWLSADGGRYTFESGTSGGYISIDSNNLTLSQAAIGYEIATKENTAYIFDATGLLVQVVDRNGNATTFNYTGNYVTSVTDSFGNVTTLTYDINGRVASITDSALKTTLYTYDAVGNLSSEVRPDNTVTDYLYDINNRLISKTNCCGGLSYSYTYNASGKVETVTDSNGAITSYSYDDENRITTVTNPLGAITQVTKDRYGNPVSVTAPNSATTTYVYAERNLISTTDANGATTTLAYDANNNVTGIIDAEGKSSTFIYDADDNLVSATNHFGNTSTFTYDANGNLASVTDPLGNITTISYDLRGLPVSVTAPNGAVATYNYNANGELVSTTDALGNVTEMTYNLAGSLLTLKNALNDITSYQYDVMERVTTLTDALGNITRYVYNGLGSVTSVTDAEGKVTSFAYDLMQRLISETDAAGEVTAYTYDATGRVVTITNPKNEVLTYTYDAMGNVITRTDFDARVTSYEYDSIGRLSAVTKPDGARITYAYDIMGRLINISYPDGTNDLFTFNPATGLLSSSTGKNGTLTFTYDSYGRLTSVHDSFTDKDVSYGYDIYSRLSELVYPTGRTISYGYDTVGRINSLSDAGTTYVTKTFDALSRLSALTFGDGLSTNFGYDAVSNLLSSVTAGLNSYTYQYNKTHMKKRESTGTGDVSRYTYDPLYRINRVRTNVSGSNTGETRYRYDENGNRVDMRTRRYSSSEDSSHENDHDEDVGANEVRNEVDYFYSAGNLLERMEYDLIKRHDDDRHHSKKAPDNKYESYSRHHDGEDDDDDDETNTDIGTVAFTYDLNGNIATKTENDGMAVSITSYEYDYANRLVRAVMPDGRVATYNYDVFGRRIEKKVADSAGVVMLWEKYLYSAEDIICEYNFDSTTSSLASEYIHDAGVDNVVAMVRGGVTYFYHKDALGSVTAITDSTGAVVKTYTYKTFGTISEETGTLENPYTYTGREYDSETGLFYYRARYYDSAFGRFIQKDPIGIADGMNVYVYVGNNPVNYIDPWGKNCGAIAITGSVATGSAIVIGALVTSPYVVIFVATTTAVGIIAMLMDTPTQTSGKWACVATCHETPYGGLSINQRIISELGSGSTQSTACRNAIRNCQASAAPGTYTRHCQCPRCWRR